MPFFYPTGSQFGCDLNLNVISSENQFFLPTNYPAINICHKSLLPFMMKFIKEQVKSTEDLTFGDRAAEFLKITPDEKKLYLHSRIIWIEPFNLNLELFFVEHSDYELQSEHSNQASEIDQRDYIDPEIIKPRSEQIIYNPVHPLNNLDSFSKFLQSSRPAKFNRKLHSLARPNGSAFSLPTKCKAIQLVDGNEMPSMMALIREILKPQPLELIFDDRNPQPLNRTSLVFHSRLIWLKAYRIYLEVFYIKNQAGPTTNEDHLAIKENSIIFGNHRENKRSDLMTFLESQFRALSILNDI